MSELKFRRESENLNDSLELKNLFKDLKLEQKNITLNRPKADNLLTHRLEQQKNFKEFDQRYLEKLKYDLKECNPNYNLGREWRINCQRCVPTFEMRRRGYDVTAKPRGNGFDHLAFKPYDVWENPEVIKTRGNGQREIEDKMAQWGDGARAQVVIRWKGIPSGHTFFAERVNGKTHFYDPQNASVDVTKYFAHVEPNSVSFCRVDNLKPSEKINDCLRMV